MKILRLEVCNLASLAASPEQPHVVDFTVSPLKDAGLLAITGPTGTGKSTLLDAMCLALFNEVPRLRTAHLGQDGRLTDAKDQLSFGDKRTVLSRGAVEGFARVEFQGLDGGRYRAEWRVKRAYLKADGALQAVERSLRDLDRNVVLASKAKDCAERIEQLIGMNFDQFTRAVLLAQSEFSTFLKANDGERAALLECLTDSGIYTELGKLAFQKAKTAREAKQQLEAQHGLVTPLGLDARQHAEQQLGQQQQTCHALILQLEQLGQQQAWYQRASELVAQREQAEQTQHSAHADWQTAAPQRQQLAQRQALAEVRHDYFRAKTLQSEINHLSHSISAIQQRLNQADHDLQQVDALRQQADQAWQTWQHASVKLKPIIAQAERDSGQYQHQQQEQAAQQQQLEKIQREFQQQQTQQQQLQYQLDQQQQVQQQVDQQLAQSQAWQALDLLLLPTLLEALQTAATEQQHQQRAQQQYDLLQPAQHAAQQQCEQVAQQLQQLRQQYGDDLALQQRFSELVQQKNTLQTTFTQLQQLHQDRQQLQQLEQQLLTHQASITQLEQQLVQQQQLLRQTERDVEQSRIAQNTQHQQLQRQRMIQQQSATDLRAALQPAQPCPVCGSDTHPYAGDLVDSAELSLAEQLLQDSERQLQVLTEQWQQQQQQHTQQQVELRHTERQLAQAQQLEQEIAAKMRLQQQVILPQQQQLAAHNLLTPSVDLTDLILQQHQKLTQLEQQMVQTVAQQTEHKQYHQQHEHAKYQLEQISSETTQFKHIIQQASQQYARATQQFLPVLSPALQADWQCALTRLATESATQPHVLSELVEQWQHALQARRQHLQAQHSNQQQLAKFQQQLEALQPVLQQQQQHLAQQQQQLAQRQSTIETLRQQIAQVLPVDLPSVAAWQAQLERQSSQLTTQQQIGQQQYQQAQQQQQTIQHELAAQQQDLTHQKQQRDTCAARVLACREQYVPSISNESLAELMAIDEPQFQQLQQQIQQQQRSLDQADARLEQLQQQIVSHQTTQPNSDPIAISSMIQQQQTALQQAQQQQAEINHLLREDDRRRTHYQALAQQIEHAEAEHQRWAKLADPIGCKDGVKFRKIAQGYQLDSLLFYANQQLQLFAPRYQLQRAPNSLGLLVVDADLANERRAVHSLSGGESFLVSLALALALAQMASGQMQIESLFIDEGFGSLDPESLQVVMDALDQLQGQGRKVAVITHVQEMQERIPVQIRVERVGSGRSVLRVIG